MNDRRPRTLLKHRFHIFTFIAVFMLAGIALSVPFASVRSGSASINGSRKVSGVTKTANNGARLSVTSKSVEFSPAPLVLAETVSTFDGATCSIPQTDFNLGEIVCVKATGVPSSLWPWRVNWVGPYGLINESDAASLDENEEYRYTLPSTATEVINGQTVDHRGRWRVNLAKANGAIRRTAWFTVHEVGNLQADVLVEKIQRDAADSIHVGDNVAFVVAVQNAGPDSAADVHVVDSPPAGATLVSFNQDSGPACTPSAPGDCTIALLTNGARAEFTAVYTIAGSPGPSQTSASISSTTPEPNTDNDTATANFVIDSGSAGGGTCELTCPSDITAFANTTEGGERGAHVNYDAALGTGSCGAITSTPASGSFFPVGTTQVTATSATGDGQCHFTITVEEATGNVSISCPANLEGNANANCEASFNLGTPTTAGDNVTVTVSRSDGKPMYDCDVNGENCVRKTTDLPFGAGVTTVTWIAYSHSTPGPYASPDDEEAARNGSATCAQTITVNDVTPPTITASNTSASADANCEAPVPDYSTLGIVTDNCACASSDTSEICDSRTDIVIVQSPAAGTMVGLGPHTITLTANDGSSNNNGAGNTATFQVTFTVNDTTPPTFTLVPPTVVASTGPGATTCDTVISDATIGTATATDNCGGVTISRSPSGNTFPVGNTTITWTATDTHGNSSTATQTVTVIDNTAPTITLNGYAPSMWPPNHKYQTFNTASFIASVFDNCGGVSVNDVVIAQVTSDETENGNGDGNTTNDIVIAANCKSVQLRSERDGGGDGRVYTITFRLTDTHGNTTTATAKVVVPHNPGATPVDSGVHYTVNGTCP